MLRDGPRCGTYLTGCAYAAAQHKKPRSGGGWFDWGSGSSSKQPKKETAATPKPSANPPIPVLKPHVPAAPAPPRKTEGPEGKKEGGGRQWV